MNFNEIIFEELLSEAVAPPSGKGVIFLDIDDTLLSAQGMKIYRKLPSDDKEVVLTPAQYAKEKVTAETKPNYDYRDFRDAQKVGDSIKNGKPIIKNLKIVDAHIASGWQVGLLTARGMEDTIHKSVKKFLKYYDTKSGKLVPIGNKLSRSKVFAINDAKYDKEFEGKTDFERKGDVLMNFIKDGYAVKFLDDDSKNIKKARDLFNKYKKGMGKNVIQAHEARPEEDK